jgi:hypothetical protein
MNFSLEVTMKKDCKGIVKKYYISLFLSFLIYMAAMLAIWLLLDSPFLQIFLIAACVVSYDFLLRYLGVKNFLSVLIVEKDAVRFAEILEPSKTFSPSAMYRVLAAYYSGDMQKTVNICAKALKDEAGIKQTYFYISMLARAYFELGDDRKLRAVIAYFKSSADLSGRADSIRKIYGVMEFFEAYLAKDITLCEKVMRYNAENDKRTYVNLAEPQSKFLFAVASYRFGNSALAAELFEDVIRKAPKTHFSRSAHKYLDAIAMETPEILECGEVLPDESFEIYGKKMRAFLKIKKPLLAFIFVCIAASIVVLAVYL